jgi:hypothetical protein
MISDVTIGAIDPTERWPSEAKCQIDLVDLEP